MKSKLINFDDFESEQHLNSKIDNKIIESLVDILRDDAINESSFFDSIKNKLSKSFLGSLSYINMIDKVRDGVLNIEKEVLTKRYNFFDEIDSLKKQAKEASDGGTPELVSKTKETIDIKTKEQNAYEKSSNLRIEKALKTIKDAIKGNNRRREYYEAGKSQDELDLAEFEYSLAKKRSFIKSEDIKKLSDDLKKAKEVAQEQQAKLKAEQEKEKVKKEASEKDAIKSIKEGEPDFKKSLKTEKGIRALIVHFKKQKADLEDSLLDVKETFLRQKIKNQILDTQKSQKIAEEALRDRTSNKMITRQKKHEEMMQISAEMEKRNKITNDTLMDAEISIVNSKAKNKSKTAAQKLQTK